MIENRVPSSVCPRQVGTKAPPQHKDHNFQRLTKVYEEHVERIRTRMTRVTAQLLDLEEVVLVTRDREKELLAAKAEQRKDLQRIYDTELLSIEQQHLARLDLLTSISLSSSSRRTTHTLRQSSGNRCRKTWSTCSGW